MSSIIQRQDLEELPVDIRVKNTLAEMSTDLGSRRVITGSRSTGEAQQNLFSYLEEIGMIINETTA